MRLLLDANVAIDLLVADRSRHREAYRLFERVSQSGSTLVLVPQVVSEVWNVLTRPAAANGIGFPPLDAAQAIRGLASLCEFKPDPDSLTEDLLATASDKEVRGRQIHDARLAVLVRSHGLDGIITRNGADFARYDVRVFEPSDLTLSEA
jgi:predicted nucleic acid-binding protein